MWFIRPETRFLPLKALPDAFVVNRARFDASRMNWTKYASKRNFLPFITPNAVYCA